MTTEIRNKFGELLITLDIALHALDSMSISITENSNKEEIVLDDSIGISLQSNYEFKGLDANGSPVYDSAWLVFRTTTKEVLAASKTAKGAAIQAVRSVIADRVQEVLESALDEALAPEAPEEE